MVYGYRKRHDDPLDPRFYIEAPDRARVVDTIHIGNCECFAYLAIGNQPLLPPCDQLRNAGQSLRPQPDHCSDASQRPNMLACYLL